MNTNLRAVSADAACTFGLVLRQLLPKHLKDFSCFLNFHFCKIYSKSHFFFLITIYFLDLLATVLFLYRIGTFNCFIKCRSLCFEQNFFLSISFCHSTLVAILYYLSMLLAASFNHILSSKCAVKSAVLISDRHVV